MFKFLKQDYYELKTHQAIFAKIAFTQKARLELFKKMIPFMHDNVDLHRLIELLGKEYAALSSMDPRALVLKEWSESMANANNFSTAIEPWVSRTDAMMLATGEESGDLITAMKNVVKANENTHRIISSVKSELTYPALLLLVLMGVMAISKSKIIPTLLQVLPYERWPIQAQSFMKFTHFFTDSWQLVLVLILSIILGVKYSFNNWTNVFRRYFDRIPPWSSFRSISSAMFLISLSALMSTGMPTYNAVSSLSRHSSRYVRFQLKKTLSLMDNGRPLGEALDTDFMPRETGMDIRIYSQASDSTKSIESVGRNAIENTIKSISRMAGVLKITIMASVGLYMLWMMTSFQSVSNALKASMPV